MTQQNKYILVTGGAGYIGSHACKYLNLAGYIPITFDSLITGWEESVKYGPFEKGDLLNKNDIDYVFKKYSPIAVMHFAALIQVGESMVNPGLYWKNNTLGSLNLIQSAIDHGCMKFIFSSTCATYGDQDNVILDEFSIQVPTNAYAASKLAVEKIISNYHSAFGLEYVIFRYFNVAGADSDGDIGEYHQPETHLIPVILDVMHGKSPTLKVFGTDYDTIDGTCVRDYVHVSDIVDAHILGLNWLLDGNISRDFNLGTGIGFSVREVINQAIKLTNINIDIEYFNRRPGDCAKLVSSSNRAKSELSWNPYRSTLDQMINTALKWYRTGGYSK
jgi:UDP-glucose 4-epimerase